MTLSKDNNMVYYSRSAVTTDWSCPRKRYWNYQYKGRGLSPDITFLELFMGIIIHDGLAAIAEGLDIDEIATAAQTQMHTMLMENMGDKPEGLTYANEQSCLVEGMLRGFHKHTWPKLLAQYPEIVAIERETTYEHDGLMFLSKPDLILKDKSGQNWYLEYKSTSNNSEAWVSSWTTAIQLHSSMKAVGLAIGEPIAGAIVQGLYKGFFNYGKQTSPFCYGYHKFAEPPFQKEVWAYDYKYGLKKYPIWLMEGGVKKWIDGMSETMLAQQFPQVPPVLMNEELVDKFWAQRASREHDIAIATDTLNNDSLDPATRESILDKVFPQVFEKCQPPFGRVSRPCEYLRLCHGAVDDPLTAGYVMRTSHHSTEEEYLKEKDGEAVHNI